MTSTIIRNTFQRSNKPHSLTCFYRTSSQLTARSLLQTQRSCSFIARNWPSVSSVFTHTSLSRPARRFSASRSLASSSNPVTAIESFPDPERPDLFYHLFHPPVSSSIPVFALSFLPEPPKSVESCTVIGWLPANAGEQEEGDAGLNDFVENGV